MRAQFKLECAEKLKIMLLVLVDVAKVKMTFSLGSIAIPMFAAMVTSPKLECAENHPYDGDNPYGDNFVTRIVIDVHVNTRYLQIKIIPRGH